MKLYCILFDSRRYHVEAESIAKAVEYWRRHVAVEWGDDYDGTEEPESIALVHDEAVIRAVIAHAAFGELRPRSAEDRATRAESQILATISEVEGKDTLMMGSGYGVPASTLGNTSMAVHAIKDLMLEFARTEYEAQLLTREDLPRLGDLVEAAKYAVVCMGTTDPSERLRKAVDSFLLAEPPASLSAGVHQVAPA